ncbi:aminotransferase class V-fold PLP-dependent enzyme [Microbulbifer sp. TYP-18]|uniref:aminotransferase class V-fold PLP-dependent enzyme n=1 Tax=Microbulbifer sp. TYP-18 TaxID=3230024 RepID=UPI0034C5EE39
MQTTSNSSTDTAQQLSQAQRRLWQIERICGRRSLPNCILALRLQGEGEQSRQALSERMWEALETIVGTNSPLRSHLVVDSEPRWQEQRNFSLPIHRHFNEAEKCIHQQHLAAFDLETELPWRAFQIDDQGAQIWVLVFHPLVMNGQGLDDFFTQLQSQLMDLDRPRLQPAEKAQDTAQDSQSFADLMAKACELQAMPTDFARDAVKHFDCRQLSCALEVDPSVSNATLGEALLGCFSLLLARYGQQSELLIGVSGLGEQSHGTDALAALRPLQLRVDEDLTVTQFGAHISAQLATMRRDSPLSIEGFLAPGISANAMSFVPVAQYAFALEDGCGSDDPASCANGVSRIALPQAERTLAHSDLALRVRLCGPRAECTLVYAKHLFSDRRIKRMVDHLQRLWQAMQNTTVPLCSLDMMTDEEHQLVQKLNATAAPAISVRIDEAVARQCDQAASRTAIIDGDRQLTYGQLAQQIDQVASGLCALGVEAGTPVGVFMPRGLELVVCATAILRCGAVYVPLDRQYPPARIATIASKFSLALIVALNPGDREALPGQCVSWSQLVEPIGSLRKPENSPPTPGDAAYLMFTSGSTGEPKGVLASHASVMNRIGWAESRLDINAQSICCFKTRLAFVDHISELFQALVCGATLVIADEDTVLDPARFSRYCQAQGITHLTLVPGYLDILARADALAEMQSLKVLISSGEPLSFGMARQVMGQLPAVRLFNIYGMTEAGADSLAYEVPLHSEVSLASFFSSSAITSGFDSQAPEDDLVETYTRPGISLTSLTGQFTDTNCPAQGISEDEYRNYLNQQVLPYTVNVGSGKFVGHMTSALPGFMAELSAQISQMNQNMVKVETSKALTLLERQLIATLHRMFYGKSDATQVQDPAYVFGLVASGGSSANITAMWNARQQALMAQGLSKADIDRLGAFNALSRTGHKKFAIVASRLAHYSIRKAVSLLGLGEENLIVLRQHRDQRADLEHLKQTLQHCRDESILVIAVIGIAGATETGTIDPIESMGEIAGQFGVHFHVDAAWGGALVFSDRHRHLLAGISRADSITLCPHKQLYVPQGISLCLFRNPRSVHASAVHAVYQGQEGSFDMGQYTLEGSRPAIFLSLHAMVNLKGRRGIGDLIDEGIDKTRYFAGLIDRHPAFQLIGTPSINILNYRYIPKAMRHNQSFSGEEIRQLDQAVELIQKHQFEAGRTFVSKTRILHGEYGDTPISVFRVVIANPFTRRSDLIDTLDNQLCIAEQQIEQPITAGAREPGIHPVRLDLLDRHQISIGTPIDNTEVFVVDANGRPLPPGIDGELAICGAGVALEISQENPGENTCFPHPYEKGKKLLRTGDYGRYGEDGVIEFRGRRDANIKLRGMRINLTEIEHHISSISGVRECAVLVGSGGKEALIHAFVVLNSNEGANGHGERKLRQHLLQQLPVSMMPGALHLVDFLPRTISGKVHRAKLMENLRPAQVRAGNVDAGTQQKLAALWKEVLEVPVIAKDDNFFELGGHSISATLLHQRVKKELKVDLGLHTLFEFPTLSQQAEFIDGFV